ncbi:MAG TPA: hypothetical protein VGB04_07465 [Allosphingosinicella sp.]|jgi:hypothetical protein
MIAAAAPIARDYVVSTTYRKEEQAGLKWSRLRGERDPGGGAGGPPRPDRPEDDHQGEGAGQKAVRELRFLAAVPGPSVPNVGSIADIALGRLPAAAAPPEAVLATMLEHVALPLRWEPLNVATEHRGIPSGGGAFGAELYLVAAGHDGLACFRHVSQDGALKLEGSGPALQGILGGADLAFVIVGSLARYLNPYGEFSPCLASLECGLMQAQLSLLCRAHAWTSETVTLHDYRAVSDALQLGHWSRIPAVVIRVTGPGAGEAVTGFRRETLSTSEVVASEPADEYPRMRRLIDAIVNEPAPPSAGPGPLPEGASPAGLAAGSSIDLLDLIRHRSSGLSADLNRQDGRTTMAVLSGLAAEIALLHSLDGATDLAGVRLSMTLVATDQAGGRPMAFDVDLRDGRLTPAAEPSTRWSQFMFTIGVDDVAEERRSGSRSFILNHIAAGALAQKICLAATAQGLFARPLRGYSEASANMFLGLEFRAILQIACGVRRQANPAYDLRWW